MSGSTGRNAMVKITNMVMKNFNCTSVLQIYC